ncbi:MAG: MBL fold metallo-hydrolase [Deltaproteobacteria bacterium]|nr:MBL fold metallo-hydrolase [Deltaproteobacteria bacterium]
MSYLPEKTENGVKIGPVELIWANNSTDFFFSNSIFIQDPEATLVDPSANFSYFEQLASQKKVKRVLNTHYHIDHRSLNSLFRNAIFMCHELDLPSLSSFDNYLKYADQVRNSEYIQWLQEIFSRLDIRDPYFSVTFKDGDLLPLKDQKVEIIHLPGHTPGHIGLFFHEIDLLYTSDIDLTPLGPWYANISSSIEEFQQSIQRIQKIECQYYATSHGRRVYSSEQFFQKLERFGNAFEKRELKILENLQKSPLSLEELSKIGIIYRKVQLDTDPLKVSFERQMIEKHLNKMTREKLIYQEKGLWHSI